MPIQFTCPHCGQLLIAEKRQVGHPGECTRCRGGVLVPPPSLPQSPSDTQSPEAQRSTAFPSSAALDANVESEFLPSAGPGSTPGDFGPIALSRPAIYTIGGLLAGIAIISFCLGWSFGSELSKNRLTPSQSISRRISGRVSYLTHRGKLAPDSEAVVAAFPSKRKPDEKIDPSELRPDVIPSEVNSAVVNAIRALGGDFARTDRTGSYEIEVPSPGEYYLLVISNHRSRRHGRQPTTREVVQIGHFVTRATELLKDNDFVWSKQFVTTSLNYDYQFVDE